MEHIVKLSKVSRVRNTHNGDMEEHRNPAGFIVCENRACAMAIMTDMAHNSYAVEGGIKFWTGVKGSTFIPYDTLDMIVENYTSPSRGKPSFADAAE